MIFTVAILAQVLATGTRGSLLTCTFILAFQHKARPCQVPGTTSCRVMRGVLVRE